MAIPAIRSYELPPESALPECRARWALEPSRAALLVHDMQAYFLRAFEPTASPIRPVLANIKVLLAACDRAGIPVLFSVQPGEQSRAERGLLWDLWGPGIVEHPALAALGLDIGAVPQDAVIAKRRYSAFFETRLHDRLRELGRDQLLISGIYAHIGCLATAVDAFMRGVQPFFLTDATADFSREDHEVAIRQVARTSGVLITTRQVEHAIEASLASDGQGPRPAPERTSQPWRIPAPTTAEHGYKARSYALMPSGAGRILDLGCGTGDDVLAIAENASGDTYVVGLDTNLDVVEEARRRARHAALNVRFAVGDARALPFPDDAFDVVRADRLLQELEDRLRVVGEIARVTRPGGCVLIHDREDVLGSSGTDGASARDASDVVSLLERVGLVAVSVADTWSGGGERVGVRGLSVRAFKADAERTG